LFSRSLFGLTLEADNGTRSTYMVDVRQLGDMDDGEVRARLYLNDRLLSFSKLPAVFSVPGGQIEVDVGSFGMRRCHFVKDDGTAIQLAPHPGTAEGKRALLHRRRPRLSRAIGMVSMAVVLIGACVTLPQLIETLTRIPPVAQALGIFEAPIKLSSEANVVIGAAAFIGSIERALRLRTSWLDSLASE
jgi:hypothetical protein